jgi:Gpi18-like mannosyltransferase
MVVSCGLLLALGLIERFMFLPARTIDMILYLTPWLQTAERAGGSYLSHAFTNYTAFYEHCLALIALFPGPEVLRVKIFAILCDVVLALMVTLLAPPGRRLLAAAVTLALPTIAMNSALLAQSDAIYGAMVVACIAAALRKRPVWTMLAFSAAIAVKLQALLAAPFLVLLWLDRRQPLWTFAMVPLAYLVFALPMAVAGRPLLEIFGVYGQQFDFFKILSNNAPNIWQVGQGLMSYEHGLMVGLPGAMLVMGAAVLLLWRAGTLHARDGILMAAAILLILAPYVTPKMHDRYFYLVDPVLVALACRDRRFLMPMLLAQAASIFAYVPFIADTYIAGDPIWGRAGSVAVATGFSYPMLPLLGTATMGGALVLLVGEAYRRAQWRPLTLGGWPWASQADPFAGGKQLSPPARLQAAGPRSAPPVI